MTKRWLYTLLAAVCALGLITGCGKKDKEKGDNTETAKEADQEEQGETPEDNKEPVNLTFWYTQPELESYFTMMAASYEQKTGNTVTVSCVPLLDYLERINDASIADENFPDAYMLTTDQLERAYLTGLAALADEKVVSADNFTQKALYSVTYENKKIAYPLFTDTSVVVYNKAYMENAPASIEEIKNFSETFEGDELISDIFLWDVSDIFVDFFPIGYYIELGGNHGDDLEQFTFNSDRLQECFETYSSLNQFFAIDSEVVTEESIINDFAEGRIVCAIIRGEAVSNVQERIEETGSGVNFGVGRIPHISSEVLTRALSITHSLAVNGYSHEPEAAADFVSYLTVTGAQQLFDVGEMIPACKNVTYSDEKYSNIADLYVQAQEVPKVMEMSDYWLLMQPVFEAAWRGEDVSEMLKSVEETMRAALGI